MFPHADYGTRSTTAAPVRTARSHPDPTTSSPIPCGGSITTPPHARSRPRTTSGRINFTSDLEDADRRFRFLIRDRDTRFTAPFDEIFKAIGISAIATPVRSPKANALAERFVRTVREDCPDHLLIYSMCHLQAVLADYVRHYNEARPHRGRQLAPPLPRHDQPHTGEIYRRDIFGGIIHEYDRAA